MTLGTVLRRQRVTAGLSRHVVADVLGISARQCTAWEADHACPSPAQLRRLAGLFQLPAAALLGGAGASDGGPVLACS
jgi:transcriptional regulator with XRE-family HTH domain